MKVRTSLPRQSRKKAAQDAALGIKRYSTVTAKPKPIKQNAKRAAKRLARTHGPKVFREFTKAQACKACGRLWHSENAHVLGNGGMGRKKDWTTVAPLCGPGGIGRELGCHRTFDEHRVFFNSLYPDFDPARAVAEHQAAYAAYLRENPE